MVLIFGIIVFFFVIVFVFGFVNDDGGGNGQGDYNVTGDGNLVGRKRETRVGKLLLSHIRSLRHFRVHVPAVIFCVKSGLRAG